MIECRTSWLAAVALLLSIGCAPSYRSPSAEPLQLDLEAFPTVVESAQVSFAVPARGEKPQFTFSGLPPGLSGSSDGLIHGRPSAAGEFPVHIHLEDEKGQTIDRDAPWQVVGAIALAPVGPQRLNTGEAYELTLGVSGGQPPYYWIPGGSFPPGVSLDGATLRGIPQVAMSPAVPIEVPITVRDSLGAAASEVLSFVVADRLAFSDFTWAVGNVGLASHWQLPTHGGAQPVVEQIDSGALPPGLTLYEDGTIQGAPTAAGIYTFGVTASDAIGQTVHTDASLEIVPNRPPSTNWTWIPAGTVGQPYDAVLVAEDGAPPLTWTTDALPMGLSLDPSGHLTGIPSEVVNNGSRSFTVTDVNGQSAYFGTPWYWINPLLEVGPAAFPAAYAGESYSTVATCSGGSGACRFSTSPLPPGLELSPAAVSGTVTSAGLYAFRLEAEDEANPNQHVAIPIELAVLEAPRLAFTSLSDALLGTSYLERLEVTGGQAPFQLSVSGGALPPGLALASEGTLDGSPTQPGTFAFTVRVTDANGHFTESPLTLEVVGSLAVSPGTLAPVAVNVPTSQAMSAQGGVAPYTWSLAGGALPAGLTLSADGRLTGTPTETGDFTFSIQLSDAAPSPATRTRSISLRVFPAPTLSEETLEGGGVGSTYARALQVDDGKQPLSFSLAAGALPPGLSLTDSGVLVGQATSAGDFSFSVQVADALGQVATRPYLLTISPPISIGPAELPKGALYQDYSAQLNAAGGAGSFEYAISSGRLPDGLTLSASGLISGRPSERRREGFVVRVTDADGSKAWRSYRVRID